MRTAKWRSLKKHKRSNVVFRKLSQTVSRTEAKEIRRLLELTDYCDRMNAEYERALAALNPYRIGTSTSSNPPVST